MTVTIYLHPAMIPVVVGWIGFILVKTIIELVP